jgi:orotate phosphoribosyltransferase
MFVQKFRVFEDPALTRSLGEALAHHYQGKFDVVACPAVGAIVLGFAAALAANKKMIFAERTGEGLEFRRGFSLTPHERVLVVEDVITTGGSAREVVDLVKASGAEPIGIGALIDRCDPSRDAFGVPFHALVELKVESWDASDCPLCADGTPLEEPGSRRLRR